MGERWNRSDRFRPDELDGDATAGEQAEVMATARELEWLAATDDIAPSAGFADRVMVAVAAEPTPRPVRAAASAARRGALFGVLAAFGDVWRVATTGGRPLAVRAPAMAVVALVLVASLGAGALGVGALSGLVNRPDQSPEPTPVTSPGPPTLVAEPVAEHDTVAVSSAEPEPGRQREPGCRREPPGERHPEGDGDARGGGIARGDGARDAAPDADATTDGDARRRPLAEAHRDTQARGGRLGGLRQPRRLGRAVPRHLRPRRRSPVLGWRS